MTLTMLVYYLYVRLVTSIPGNGGCGLSLSFLPECRTRAGRSCRMNNDQLNLIENIGLDVLDCSWTWTWI